MILPKAYGLYKEGVPFIIIVSSINTALYFSANYLQDIISENIPPAKSRIKNCFEFHNKLIRMTIGTKEIIVSFDVTSLFINIPLDIALDKLERR